MKLQIIQLEPYDDVVSVRDRLSFVSTERVLLVWPRRGEILKRKLDLLLIQREAARQGARLALISDDPAVRDHASELNISTFESIKASQRGRWKRPRSKVFVDRSDRPEDAPDAYALREITSRLRPVNPAQVRFERSLRRAAAVVLGVGLLVVIVLFVPSAQVTIHPAQAQINTTVKLIADPSLTQVNVESGRIPATIIKTDVTTQATIPTTGSGNVPNTLASGTVIFTNNTDQPVFIPSGTVVSTFGFQPAHFHTTADATLDGGNGKTVTVTIEAAQDTAGAAGNIEPNLIINVQGALSQSVSVRNSDATRGGTVRQQGIVTQADHDNLLVLAREKIRQTALGEFKLSATQVIVPDTIRIAEERPEWTTYSAFVNDPSDTLTLSMKATVQAVVIDTQLAKQAAIASLALQIPQDRQIVPASVTFKPFAPGDILGEDSKGNVTFLMSAAANVAVIVDVGEVRRRISGTGVDQAVQTLENGWLLDSRFPPDIQVWPEFIHRLPVLAARISVNVAE